MAQKDKIENALKVEKIFRSGPRVKVKKPDWDFLVYELRKLKVTPGEAYRIISAYKDKETNIRFDWKMLRFTMFVWERVKEDKNLFLKRKIETIREVVSSRMYKDFFQGYFPGIEFEHEKEVKLLNKLIHEKPQKQFFQEGNYFYYRTQRVIPQAHLDKLVWGIEPKSPIKKF
jgi:hypothetical protein